MRIAIYSLRFAPEIGGIETVVSVLAEEFVKLGQEVLLLTQSRSSAPDDLPYSVVRGATMRDAKAAVKWCDLYLLNNVSLYHGLAAVCLGKPFAIIHHSLEPKGCGVPEIKRLLKRTIGNRGRSIAVSRYIAQELPGSPMVICNPYDNTIFKERPEVVRDGDLIFVGRLVKEKGVDILLEALAIMRNRNLKPRLTIVGDGPERTNLIGTVKSLDLSMQVDFAGPRTGEDLVSLLNGHRILVVPSVWQEPFGVVALEGSSCGCVVVASDAGGLKEAVGSCGLTFTSGSANALAVCLEELLRNPERLGEFRSRAAEHLSMHSREYVADRYLGEFRRMLAEAASSR
jgi:glycogen synthase